MMSISGITLLACGVGLVGLLWLAMRTSWLRSKKSSRVRAEDINHIGEGIEQLLQQELSKVIRIEGGQQIMQLGQQLDKLRLQLEAAEHQQIEFLSDVAHEVKTPLSSIREGIKLINDGLLGDINSDQREVTGIILKNSYTLQSSVERLLNYNQSLANNRLGHRQTINVATLVRQAINNQSLALKAKALTIEESMQDCEIEANVSQILTVFDNLLSNAIRFSPAEGRIVFAIYQNEGKVRIEIQDEGPGVPAAQRQTVFSAFFTDPPPNAGPMDNLQGSGLGLSIARQYVELHQGSIELLDSSNGELSGAIFRVTLNHV